MGYYRGDPGFLSFLGSVAKGAVGMIPGVGGIASKAIEKIGAARTSHMGVALTTRLGAMSKMVIKHPVISAAAGAGAFGAAAEGAHMMGGGGKIHPAMKRALGLRHHKRMNVTNVRALRRALRRTHGFAKLAMRTIHLVHPKKHARFGGFKKKHRRAA